MLRLGAEATSEFFSHRFRMNAPRLFRFVGTSSTVLVVLMLMSGTIRQAVQIVSTRAVAIPGRRTSPWWGTAGSWIADGSAA